MLTTALITLSAALLSDASRASDAVPGPQRSGPNPWRDLTKRIQSHSLSTRTRLGVEWGGGLSEDWTLDPRQLSAMKGVIVDAEDVGLWHVTTRLSAVLASGQLLPGRQVGEAGLGRGRYADADTMVSVTTSKRRAEYTRDILELAVLAANHAIPASELSRRLYDVVEPMMFWLPGRDTLEARLAYLLETGLEIPMKMRAEIEDLLEEAGCRRSAILRYRFYNDDGDDEEIDADYLAEAAHRASEVRSIIEGYPGIMEHSRDLMIDNIENNTAVPAMEFFSDDHDAVGEYLSSIKGRYPDTGAGEILYSLVVEVDRRVNEHFSPCMDGANLTLPWDTFVGFSADDVRIVQVAALKNAVPEHIMGEMELRFRPDEIILSPVVYGGSR